MKITRLSWAGLLVESGKQTIIIDPVEDFSSMEPYMGKPLRAITPFTAATQADYVLLTHLHPDHFDPLAIQQVLKPHGKVVCHTLAAGKIRESGLPVVELELNEVYTSGQSTFVPVFALDGIGHEQVSWIVRDGAGKQLFHGGDTIWHSRFWEINKTYGKMDVAFLPINGVVVDYPFVGFAPLPASLTPEQAVVAARILQAELLVPMHYGTFHSPPVYSEYTAAEEKLEVAALMYRQPYELIPEGGLLSIPQAANSMVD